MNVNLQRLNSKLNKAQLKLDKALAEVKEIEVEIQLERQRIKEATISSLQNEGGYELRSGHTFDSGPFINHPHFRDYIIVHKSTPAICLITCSTRDTKCFGVNDELIDAKCIVGYGPTSDDAWDQAAHWWERTGAFHKFLLLQTLKT